MGWLSGWQYRKQLTITGSSAGDVTDYQIKLIVYYGSGTDTAGSNNTDSPAQVYLNGKCNSDFSDIRFTDSDGSTTLSYWMESYVDSDHAVFWVKVPSISSSSGATIYIYYGNSSAVSESDGDSTFILFDHFDGSSLDTNKWALVSGTTSSYVYVDNSHLVIKRHDGYYESVYSLATAQDNVRIRFYGYATLTNNGWAAKFDAEVPSSNTTYGHGYEYVHRDYYYSDFGNQVRIYDSYNGSDMTNRISPTRDSNYHYWEMLFSGGHVKMIWDDTIVDNTYTYTIHANKLILFVEEKYAAGDIYLDYVLVAKWLDPEPYISAIGSEETGGVSYSQSLSDTITSSDAYTLSINKALLGQTGIGDVLSRDINKALADASTSSDSLVVEIGKHLLDSIPTADEMYRAVEHTLSDTLASSDAVAKSLTRPMSDSTTSSDIMYKGVSKPVEDSASLTSYTYKSTTKLGVDSIGMGEELYRSMTHILSDVEPVADIIARGIHSHLLDAAAVSDVVGLSVVKSLLDYYMLQETHSSSVMKALLGSCSLSDASYRSISHLLSDYSTYTDTLSVIRALMQRLSDALSASDYSTLQTRKAILEYIAPSDAITSIIAKQLYDASTLVDTIITAVSHHLSLLDSLLASDTAGKSSIKSVIDTASTTDLAVSTAMVKAILDMLDALDYIGYVYKYIDMKWVVDKLIEAARIMCRKNYS